MDIELGTESGGRGEQLSSFALRCAERLSVPFRDFYRELVAPLIYEGRTMPNSRGIPVNGMVDGLLRAASMWVYAMNSLTNRSDLRRTTLLSWRQSLAPRALMRTHRAWCPACLHDFFRCGKVIYEPLVWRVADVAVCPYHRIGLEVECPYCGRGRQPSFGAFTRVGCCRECGKWLGRSIHSVSTPVNDLDVYVAIAVEDALSLSNVEEEIELVCSDVAVRAIRDVFYCGSSAQMGRSLGFLPSQVVHFAAGTFPAPLLLFVRASYMTGATMEQIFVTNRFNFDETAPRERQFEVKRSVPRRIQTGADLAMKLNNAIADGGKQSVGAIAAGLNITATSVWRRERELASRLAQMHAVFVSKETQGQKEQYRAKVFAFVTACAAQGVKPGRRLVDAECGGVGRFASDWKRSIIKDAMEQVASRRAEAGADVTTKSGIDGATLFEETPGETHNVDISTESAEVPRTVSRGDSFSRDR